MLVLPACGWLKTTTVIEKPVAVVTPPCGIPPFPMPDPGIEFTTCLSEGSGSVCTTQQSLEQLAAWVSAVADWRDAVLACKQVTVLKVPATPTTGIPVSPVTPTGQGPVKSVVDAWDSYYHPDDLECARIQK